MKLTILGSGTFFVDKDVTASSFVLDTGESKILVDCGPGTLVSLSQAGFTPEDIDYVFISHFHPDHTSDLFPFFMNFRLKDVFDPDSISKFPVICGPEGLDRFLLDYSHLTQLHAYEDWGKIEIREYDQDLDFDGFDFEAFKVEHGPFGIQGNTYALRFEANNKVVTFSGDSNKCEGLQKSCKNADLFVCDCSSPKDGNNAVHLTTTEIGEVARDSDVDSVLLVHFYPQYADHDLVGEVREVYDGEVLDSRELRVWG